MTRCVERLPIFDSGAAAASAIGFCGDNWKHVIITRAIDLKCPVVYSDTSRAMIAGSRGEVFAEAKAPESVVVADVEIGRS